MTVVGIPERPRQLWEPRKQQNKVKAFGEDGRSSEEA